MPRSPLARRLAALLLAAGLALAAGCSGDAGGRADTSPTTTPTSVEVPAEPSGRGPYSVGYTERVLTDDRRDGRQLVTSIWYPVPPDAGGDAASYEVLPGFALTRDGVLDGAPAAEGPFPLVVFSHGNGGTRIQSLELTETLASHGFVVAAPDHTGNTFLETGDVEAALRSATDRPPDVSFVIDAMLSLADDPDTGLEIDEERIGVSGHSYGGFTALAIAGGTPDWPADERVDAIVALAPASSLVADEALRAIDVPTLLMGATLDETTPIDPEITRPFELVPATDVYRVDVIDADHNSFTMICSAEDYLDDPGMPSEIVDLAAGVLEDACAPEVIDGDAAMAITNRYVVAFFLTHLAGDDWYASFLTPVEGVEFDSRG